MSASAGKVRIVLEVDDTDVNVRFQRATGDLRRYNMEAQRTADSVRRIERNMRGILPTLRDFTIVTSLASGALYNLRRILFDWQAAIIKSNAEIERMVFLLKGMSGATTEMERASEAAKDFHYILNMAQNAPFNLDSITNGFVKMKAVGLDPTDGTLQSIVDSVASFGGNADHMNRAIIAIQQMAGKGVISMEELRQQLGEAVPNAIKLMARAVGMEYGEMVKQISLGNVKAKESIQLMAQEMDRTMGGAAQRMMNTWTGTMERAKTEVRELTMALGGLTPESIANGDMTGYFATVREELKNLVDLLGSGQAQYYAREIGRGMEQMVVAVREGIQLLWEHRTAIQAVGAVLVKVGLAALFLRATTAAWGLLRVVSSFGATAAANFGRATRSIGLMVAMMARGQMTLGRMRVVVGTLGRAFAALLGPLGLVAIAAYEIWQRFADTSREVNGIVERIEESKGFAAQADDVEKLDTRLADLTGRLEGFQKMAKSGDSFARATAKQELAAYGEAWKKEIEEIKRARVLAKEELLRRELEMEKRHADRQVDEARQAAQGVYNAAMEAAVKERDAAKGTEEAKARFREAQVEATKALFGAQIAAIDDDLEAAKQKMAEAKALIQQESLDDANFRQFKKMEQLVLFLQNKSAEINGTLKEHLEAFNQGVLLDPTRAMGKADDTPGGKLLKELNNQLDRLREKASEPGSNAFLVRIEAELAKLRDGPEVLAQIREAARKLHQETGEETFAETMRRANEELAKLDSKLQGGDKQLSWTQRFLSGEFGEIDAINDADLTDAILKMAELDDRIKEVDATLDAMKDRKEMTRATSEIEARLLGPRAERLAAFNQEVADYKKHLATLREGTEEHKAYLADYNLWFKARSEELTRELETPVQKLARTWQDTATAMENATASWMESSADALAQFVMTGKLDFKSLANSIIQDIIRIQMRKMMAGLVTQAVGMMGSMGGSAVPSTAGTGAGGMNGYSFNAMFADGGVMTKYGKAQLRAYANGGIANSPQVALFGEGSRPEAFVPLPDGKSIPVSMRGGGAPAVTVNVINQSGQPVNAEQGTPKMDGERMVLDVVLKAVNQPGAFRDSMKGALR